jgi:alanine dehydrogenase
MLILTEPDLRLVLKMHDVIDAVEAGFRAMARGDTVVPERLRLGVPGVDAVLLEMPAYLKSSVGAAGNEPGLGTKIVGVFPENRERSLEVVQAVYLLLDPVTGVPLALMEGRFITGIRTAATSAVATKHMSTAGPKQLAVFGAGVQARFHIDAMIEAANIAQIMISSRTPQKAHELAEQVRALNRIPCEVVSADEAASRAELICTCTTSPTPLFEGSRIRAGTHINAVGAFTPLNRELDTSAVLRSRVIIDAESAAGQEAGEIQIPLAEGAIQASHVKGTLAEVVSRKIAGRETSEEITLFRSCGLAIEDLVTAKLAYAKAIATGVGTQVEM